LDSSPFDQMPVSGYSCCPLLVMAGGFSRGISPLTLANYLARTAPLFIPSGEDVAGTVSLDEAWFLRAFFLPTFAHLPIGLSWKLDTDLLVEKILQSVKGLTSSPSTSPYAAFSYVLSCLGRRLVDWLVAAQTNSSKFAVPVFPFKDVADQFPNLITGAVPDSILCTTTFAPLMDMRYLYTWRLLWIESLGALMAMISASSVSFFLARVPACIRIPTLELNFSLNLLQTCVFTFGLMVDGLRLAAAPMPSILLPTSLVRKSPLR
jgi:hypothetical protein